MGSGRRKKIQIDLPGITVQPPPSCPPNCPDPNTPDPPKEPGKSVAAVSSETIVYDTLSDSYSLIPDSTEPRMGQFAASIDGLGSSVSGSESRIYVFGGYMGNANADTPLLRTCESMDVVSLVWTPVANMPTPRAFGMTVRAGTHIYCIGGIELDQVMNKFVVSRKIERFNVSSGTWTGTLTQMPTGYGVAYGDAQTDGEFIYVVCGFRELGGNSDPSKLNDRVLRYSIAGDSWDKITPSDLDMYERVSPFAFLRGTTNEYYVCGGSLPKGRDEYDAELESKIGRLKEQFRSVVKSSDFVNSMTAAEQNNFIAEEEKKIEEQTRVSAFIYPMTGYKFVLGSEYDDYGELVIDISSGLDDEWRNMPNARDDGRAVYMSDDDKVFFFGGSNQNVSSTLSRVESVLLSDGSYNVLTPMNRGRIRFAAVSLGADVYILGGQTSGHANGYVQVNIQQFPGTIKATGTQSNGFMVTLTNDAGELIPGDIRIAVRGHIRIPEIDDQLSSFLADRAIERIRDQLPQISEGAIEELTEEELNALIAQAQNTVTNPNSDEFQMNSARKLSTEIAVFPILYSETDVIVHDGVGGFSLRPRSEDPLADIAKLSEFVQKLLNDTLPEEDQRFLGDLTREELASLGDVLQGIELPPTTVESGKQRVLYDIETTATVVDDYYFGSSVSDYLEQNIASIREKLEEMLRDLAETEEPSTQGNTSTFVRYNLSDDVFGYKTQDGQSTSSYSKLPLFVSFRDQLPSIRTTYYNNIDWIPQINKHLVAQNSIDEALEILDVLDHQVPFGGSQLYTAMFEIARVCSGTDLQKTVYIASDNSENLSLVSRDDAISEINSVDGYGKTPVVYTVFSTSKPMTIAAQLERTDKTDIERITKETNGQSTTLVDSSFISQILNLAIGGAAGSLGYGIYRRSVVFDELTAVTAMTATFFLPSNTIGTLRFRYSQDGFNFTDWSEKFEGNESCSDAICAKSIDVADFFAKAIEFEIVLSTGFTQDPDDDENETGSPRLDSIQLSSSGEKNDYLFLNSEEVAKNVQQVAVGIESVTPENAVVEIGVATSQTNEWTDFHSDARPVLREYGKTFLLERSHDDESIVPDETLTSIDGLLWTTRYGPWDPAAVATLYDVDENGVATVIRDGFLMYPRDGQIYFDTKQSLDKTFRLSIVNDNVLRVGLRIRNRLHTDSVKISGVGYIYSTNDDKPNDLVQLAPVADRLSVTPANPTSVDTFLASYRYIDPNNDREEGSVISWFKNGQKVSELAGKLTWTNANLNYNNKLRPGDSIVFSVRPSDGIDYGIEVFSQPVVIGARVPSIARPIRIVPYKNGAVVGRYDSASTFILQYAYVTDDIGPQSLEQGTSIVWYVNGNAVKSGTHDSTTPADAAVMKLLPTESSDAIAAHEINAAVQVEITPRNAAGMQGETVASGIVTVVNTKPSILGGKITIQPASPIHGVNDLSLQEPTVNDIDVTVNVQQSTLEIEWYRSTDGINYAKFAVSGNGRKIDKSTIREGDRWYVRVRPYDYVDYGDWVQSNTVVVR
jgi:hypothetical protein